MSAAKLIEAAMRIVQEGGSPGEPGDWWEYLNDDPESGIVVLRNEAGAHKVVMNAKDYFALRAKLEKGKE